MYDDMAKLSCIAPRCMTRGLKESEFSIPMQSRLSAFRLVTLAFEVESDPKASTSPHGQEAQYFCAVYSCCCTHFEKQIQGQQDLGRIPVFALCPAKKRPELGPIILLKVVSRYQHKTDTRQ